MAGYTDGVETTISEKSMNGGLNRETTFVRGLVEMDANTLYNTLLEEYDDEVTIENAKELIDDDVTYLDGYSIQLDADNSNLVKVLDWSEVINDLAEGGMTFITDTDFTILGAKMGAAGEHIGSVSVWVNTYEGTVSGHGKVLPLSDDDCEGINDALNEIYHY